jgi:N-acetylglucosamine-6-sulfatase
MEKTKQLLVENGVSFSNAFVSTPVCCPSRSSYLTGRYIHNHGAVNNTLEGNCSSPGPSWQEGPERETFAVHVKENGYYTGYFGKYLNTYGISGAGGVKHIPPGWDVWMGLVGNSKYYDYSVSFNGVEEKHGHDYHHDYFTDLITNRSVEFLHNATKNHPSQPFLLVAATPAPHDPVTPAPQFRNVYDGLHSPRTPNWNYHSNDKHWLVRAQAIMDKDTVNISDTDFRRRWETLLSVDNLVSNIIKTLNEMNTLHNTYIIYTSDHGFQLGQFCIPLDKREPYEHDIRIPMFVRGPNIPKNKTVNSIVLNIDIAPTIIEMSGSKTDTLAIDGQSFLQLIQVDDHGTESWRTDFLVDYHGEGIPPCELNYCPPPPPDDFHEIDATNNTYTCLRTLSDVQNDCYCEFTLTGYTEYYDLKKDPWQLNNTVHQLSYDHLERLKNRLNQLRQCKGATCH